MIKKSFLLTGALLLSTMPIFSETTENPADVHRWNTGQLGTSIERAPYRLPSVIVIYDSDNQTIEIECTSDCNASVKVYDMYENQISYADSMDSAIYVGNPHGDTLTVRIESDHWYAVSVIRL